MVRLAFPAITVVQSITRNLWCIKPLPLLPSSESSISGICAALISAGITAEGFVRTRGAISVAVCQAVQLMPASSVSLVQPAGSLFAPGLAVAVLQHYSNVNASLFCRDQCLGNTRQAELLNSHQHSLVGGINGCNQPLL